MSDRKEVDTHESFGLVSFDRCHGKTNLFAVSVDTESSIRLSIRRCERIRDLGRYWYHGREELIEVEMSANQFSELITHMNHGDGIPCTIKHVQGRRMEKPPTVDIRKKFEDEFEALVNEANQQMVKLRELAKSHVSNSKSTKAEREAIAESARIIASRMGEAVSFLQSQFNLSMDKTVTEAKSEFESFVNSKIHSMGVEVLTAKLLLSVDDSNAPTASDFVAYQDGKRLDNDNESGLKARWLAAEALASFGLTDVRLANKSHENSIKKACMLASIESPLHRMDVEPTGWLKSRIDDPTETRDLT